MTKRAVKLFIALEILLGIHTVEYWEGWYICDNKKYTTDAFLAT